MDLNLIFFFSRVTDYLFATMPEGKNEKIKCTSRKNSSNNDVTGVKKWLRENLLLIGTLFGVIIGIVLGIYIRNCFFFK